LDVYVLYSVMLWFNVSLDSLLTFLVLSFAEH